MIYLSPNNIQQFYGTNGLTQSTYDCVIIPEEEQEQEEENGEQEQEQEEENV